MNKNKHFGFSNIKLWPFYGIFTGLILLLMPFIGMFFAFLIVGLPSYWLLKKAVKRDTTTWEDIQLEIDAYVTKMNTPKVKAAKTRRTANWPKLTKPQLKLPKISTLKRYSAYTR